MKNKFKNIFVLLLVAINFLASCNSDFTETDPVIDPVVDPVVEPPVEEVVDYSKIYKPQEFSNMDFTDNASTWSYERSRQSDHFIVFWAKGYGANDPNSSAVSSTYRVDIDDLLAKAEIFYSLNVNKLAFAKVGQGQSKLDQYKIMIFVHYTTDWMAYGGGYDDKIGALWVSPITCHPVGSTIGHEIGHTFQYQIRCDLGSLHGFRYGFGGNGGNTFWEQTANWQARQSYPNEIFGSSDFYVYKNNYNKHLCHEWYRYASYFIHYYWADKHGIDIIGRIWRESNRPEDPIQAYMRLTGINNEQFNDEIYDAATKFVTWDLNAIRTYGKNYIGAQTYTYDVIADNTYQVSYERCPQTTGYNVIPLTVPSGGGVVSADFTGMVNASGYNTVSDASRAGWRYGYVALKTDGTRVYSSMNQGTNNVVSFTVPDNTSKLWFVVTGAPTTYLPHAWDEDESNDDQWPYKVKFTNTKIVGSFNYGQTQSDVTLTYDISFPMDYVNYTGKIVKIEGDNLSQLAEAFMLTADDIIDQYNNGKIKFYAVESNGTLNANQTAFGGHWFNASGDVVPWGSDSYLFSELDMSNLQFNIGQYPSRLQSGDSYTIKQALVYEYETGKTVQATFVFNITIQ